MKKFFWILAAYVLTMGGAAVSPAASSVGEADMASSLRGPPTTLGTDAHRPEKPGTRCAHAVKARLYRRLGLSLPAAKRSTARRPPLYS